MLFIIQQFLEELIKEKKLIISQSLDKKVAFHDPCFLGRYNDVYDAPRTVLKSIPGVELVEISPSREQAECCGGGGGGNWMDIPAGERIADRRIAQVLETGAEILAVGCPLCLVMFEDAVKSNGHGGRIEVKQIIELVDQAV